MFREVVATAAVTAAIHGSEINYAALLLAPLPRAGVRNATRCPCLEVKGFIVLLLLIHSFYMWPGSHELWGMRCDFIVGLAMA